MRADSGGLLGTEDALAHAGVDARLQQPLPPQGHALREELTEFREPRQHACHQTVQHRELRLVDVCPVCAHDAIKVGQRVGIMRRPFELVESEDDRAPDHLAKQRFLVREVEVDGAFRDARESSDIFEARLVEPRFGEGGERGIDDLGLALFDRSTDPAVDARGRAGCLRDGWISQWHGPSEAPAAPAGIPQDTDQSVIR